MQDRRIILGKIAFLVKMRIFAEIIFLKMDIQLNIQEPNHRTLINIDVNNSDNLDYIVKLLQSLNFIKKVEIIKDVEPINSDVPQSRFARFYGAAKTGLPIEVLDQKINAIRDEWERDI
jgi:hypothetical protein